MRDHHQSKPVGHIAAPPIASSSSSPVVVAAGTSCSRYLTRSFLIITIISIITTLPVSARNWFAGQVDRWMDEWRFTLTLSASNQWCFVECGRVLAVAAAAVVDLASNFTSSLIEGKVLFRSRNVLT